MKKLTLHEKAVENLKKKGIDAKIENGVVYVVVNDTMLEISDFEIRFQSDEFCSKQPKTEATNKKMEDAANHLLDNYGKKSYRERLKEEYNDEFGYTQFREMFERVQNSRIAKDKIAF
ncbi:MAG: hypothetical protein IM631_12835 [Cytophagales bacterium]|nr:hypothetical protein [Cytophagales bacterium]MCA6382403.1 hypothetical protein [Cytophagales bacterium]